MSPKLVKELREATGAGVIDCKKALEEAAGDLEKAKQIIQEKGIIKAEKRAGRKTGAGVLESYVHNNRVGVLLDIRCETDFVAHSEPFRQLAHEITMQIAAMEADSVDSLMSQPHIKDESKTIEELVKGVIAQTGENIRIERFCRYEL